MNREILKSLSNDKINETARKIFDESTFLSNVNQDFFQRIYSTPFEKYSQRLSSIGFSKMEKVLDAGCGFGQWSIAMSEMNGKVTSLDMDNFRCQIVSNFQNSLDNLNCFYSCSSHYYNLLSHC